MITGPDVFSATSMKVSWGEPTNVEGTLGGFTVSWRIKAAKAAWTDLNTAADAREYTITQLTPNTRYEMMVRGFVQPNEAGKGGGYGADSNILEGLTWSGGMHARAALSDTHS